MSDVAKVIEISASSTKSIEDAVETGIRRADESLDHVEGAWGEGYQLYRQKRQGSRMARPYESHVPVASQAGLTSRLIERPNAVVIGT